MATLDSIEQRIISLDQKFEKRFETVDKKFEQIDKRFEQIDQRFLQIDKRFEKNDARLEKLLDMAITTNQSVAKLESQMIETNKRFNILEHKIDVVHTELEEKIEQEVDKLAVITARSFKRAELRFNRLEKHAGLAFYTQ
jgi:predicted  nucleic acid-binding Zn-ribbon protein